jgi:RimJ/RimL family protein N-acetyltransferase
MLRLTEIGQKEMFDCPGVVHGQSGDTGRQMGEQMLLRPDEVHMESDRLLIRPFSAGDADAAFGCITPSLTRFMSWEPPANRDVFDRIWQGWLPTIADGSDYTFAIRQKANGSFLGLSGLHGVRNASAELGIWIREDCHAQGFGSEAVSLVASWASLALGIACFTYPVAEENYPSRRIAESLGGVVVERRETPKYISVVYRIPNQSACGK